ncbi:MAG: Ig-like domain-containing protein [Bacteroidia bacterium]
MKRWLGLFFIILAGYSSFAQINRPIGINLTGIVDWSEEYVFVDVMKQSRNWIAHEQRSGAPWSSGVSIPLRPDGYPIEIPYNNGVDPAQGIRTLMYFGENLWGHYPGGNYRFIAAGSGQISLWGAVRGTFQCPLDTILFVDSSAGGIGLEIDISLIQDPVRDIHVVMPGFHNNFENQIFHPELIDFVQDFQVIRFMDWMKTNNSPVRTWADRNHTDNFTQTTSNGVAYEYIIELCNRTYSNPWICIPHEADSMYIVNMARFLRDSLDPCLTAYVEYSNEVWNGIFAQSQYAAAQGDTLNYGGQPWDRSWKYTAKRSADIFQIFENEYTNHDRFIKVIPAWAANDWVTNYIIDRFEEPLYNPTGVTADAVAIAPYFGGGSPDRIGAAGLMASTTVSDLVDSLELSLLEAYAWMDACKVVADNHNLDLLAYEGGQHLVAYAPYHNDTSFARKILDANRDPRLQSMYCEYFEHWYDTTQAAMFCAFSSHGAYSKYGAWGMKESYADTLAPKYLGMVNCVFSQNQIDPPLALADVDTVLEDGSACFGVLSNDSEPNSDPMILTRLIRQPGFGSATIQDDSICYTPIRTYIGYDTIDYEVCDDGCPAQCSQARLIITIKQTGSPLSVFDKNDNSTNAHQAHVYPNPSSGQVTVELASSQKADFRAFDWTGKRIALNATPHGERKTTLVFGQFKGVLILEIATEYGVQYKRIVVW